MFALAPEIKEKLKDIEIDDEAHWLLGDYGREARTWAHVDVLFKHEMLSMDADALQRLKQRALTTYHLSVHAETIAKAQEGSKTIAEMILLVDEAHKKLMSALQQLEKETVKHQEMKNTEEFGAAKPKTYPPSGASYASARGSHTLAQTTSAPARQPTGASYASTRGPRQAAHGPPRAPAGASHAPTRATYNPTRASGAQASAARQAAIRNQLHGSSPSDAMAE